MKQEHIKNIPKGHYSLQSVASVTAHCLSLLLYPKWSGYDAFYCFPRSKKYFYWYNIGKIVLNYTYTVYFTKKLADFEIFLKVIYIEFAIINSLMSKMKSTNCVLQFHKILINKNFFNSTTETQKKKCECVSTFLLNFILCFKKFFNSFFVFFKKSGIDIKKWFRLDSLKN